MEWITEELARLEGKAKAARTVSDCLVSPDTLPAYDLAQTLAQIGQEFHNLSVALKQAGRRAAGEAAEARAKWAPPKLNARRAADAIERKGGHRVCID